MLPRVYPVGMFPSIRNPAGILPPKSVPAGVRLDEETGIIDSIKGKEEAEREDRPSAAMIRIYIMYASIICGIAHYMWTRENILRPAGVRLDEETMATVIEEADREDRTSAAMLRILVKEALSTRGKLKTPEKKR